MKNDLLGGCTKVFKFSLKQLLKSKGNIITIAIMCVFALISMPMASLSMSSDTIASNQLKCNASSIYLINLSTLDFGSVCTPIIESQFKNDSYSNVKIHFTDKEIENISTDEIVYVIKNKEGTNSVTITYYTAKETSIPLTDIEIISSDVKFAVDKMLLKLSGITDTQIDLIFSGINVNYMNYSDYINTFDEDAFFEKFVYQYAYSIIVLLVCTLSISYIVRAVIEEKSSKLVELLMISVKPLSLIVGKILAIMIYILIMLSSVIVSFCISMLISKHMNGFTFSSLLSLFSPAGGVNFNILNISVIIISVFITYLTMSLIAGLLGTACSSTEDMQSANLASVFLLLTGYIISCVVTAVDSPAIIIASSLCPIVSAFCAPVNFLMGSINIYVLLASLAIQLIILALIALLCGRVYKELIVYNGKRLKFSQILKLGFDKGGSKK